MEAARRPLNMGQKMDDTYIVTVFVVLDDIQIPNKNEGNLKAVSNLEILLALCFANIS